MQTNKELFISYAREDSDFALKLSTDLRAAGAKIWLDQLDIRGGDSWDDAIEDALKRCDSFLVILSPASVSSYNVKDEIAVALDENKSILPVLYTSCEEPFRLRRKQYFDLS